MVSKQLERLVSNGKKGSANKSFICFVDEKREGSFSSFNLVVFIYWIANGKLKSWIRYQILKAFSYLLKTVM